MAELNPYQQPKVDESAPPRAERKEEAPVDPVLAEAERRALRVMLGLVAIFGAMISVALGSLALAVADRSEPVPAFVFSPTVVVTLIGLLVFGVVALAWISWRILKKGYSRRRLYAFGASGWVLGLLCLGGIVRADMAAEERRAEAGCPTGEALRKSGVPGAEERAEQCKVDFIRCRRLLRRQPGYGQLTSEAETSWMRACMDAPERVRR